MDGNACRKWYVLRCHNMNSHKACAALGAAGIEWYQPWCEDIVMEHGRKVKKRVCMMKDFIFVHSTRETIEAMMDTRRIAAWFYYDLCHRAHHEPVTVRDKEMEDFMRVSSAVDRHPEIRRFDEAAIQSGARIRMMNGPLQGVEGTFIRQGKSVVVKLSNFLTASVTLDKDELVEIL